MSVHQLKRPLPGAQIGDLIVDSLYLRIWDAAVNLLRYEPKRDKQTPVKFHTRQHLLALPAGEYQAAQLHAQIARTLRRNNIPCRSQSIHAALWKEQGITVERLGRGRYRTLNRLSPVTPHG